MKNLRIITIGIGVIAMSLGLYSSVEAEAQSNNRKRPVMTTCNAPDGSSHTHIICVMGPGACIPTQCGSGGGNQ